MWCSGSGTNEWGEWCDCTYDGPEHSFDEKCIYSARGDLGNLVLKHPAEIMRLGLGVPGGIFIDVILPFVGEVMGLEDDDETAGDEPDADDN